MIALLSAIHVIFIGNQQFVLGIHGWNFSKVIQESRRAQLDLHEADCSQMHHGNLSQQQDLINHLESKTLTDLSDVIFTLK